MHSIKQFTCINLLNPHNNILSPSYRCGNWEQRGKVSIPRSHSKQVAKLEFEPESQALELTLLTNTLYTLMGWLIDITDLTYAKLNTLFQKAYSSPSLPQIGKWHLQSSSYLVQKYWMTFESFLSFLSHIQPMGKSSGWIQYFLTTSTATWAKLATSPRASYLAANSFLPAQHVPHEAARIILLKQNAGHITSLLKTLPL